MGRLYLLRHAKAGDRHRFSGDDRERPLSPAGRRQADALSEHSFQPEAPSRIETSPARRCVETVGPLAARLGLEMVEAAWLEEGSDPLSALEKSKPGHGETSLACTHGDVIWGVLEWLATEGIDLGERPDAQKGGCWVLCWSDEELADRTPTSVHYLPPPSGEADSH